MSVREIQPRKVSTKHKMVLWVDDDIRMVENITSILEKYFNIHWFIIHGDSIEPEFLDKSFHGAQIVFLVPRKFPDLDSLSRFIKEARPKAIVSDLQLGGDDLGGFSVLLRAYSEAPNIQRILFTGRVNESVLNIARKIGIEFVYSKDDLFKGVSDVIKSLTPEQPIPGNIIREFERENLILKKKLFSLENERNKLRREFFSFRKQAKSKKPLKDRDKLVQDKTIEKLRTQLLTSKKEQQIVMAHQHDLINTLALVKDGLDVVLSKPEYIPSVINDDIRRAWIAAKHSSVLLKSMGELGAGQKRIKEKPGCISRAFAEACEIISRKIPDSISLNMDISENLPPTSIPDYLLVRCALNLLLNSLDAIPDRGWIKISSRTRGTGKKKSVVVIVADNGKGIKKRDLPKVFNWDFSTKHKDYGIGLFIIKTVMERYKGDFKIDSTRGKGTSVTLKIPLA